MCGCRGRRARRRGNILRQAGRARRTFRLRAFKQQVRMWRPRVDLALCGAGMPVRRFRVWIVSPLASTYMWRSGRARPHGHAKPRQANAKEMLMVAVIERETTSEAIEATVNYILDNGEKQLGRA